MKSSTKLGASSSKQELPSIDTSKAISVQQNRYNKSQRGSIPQDGPIPNIKSRIGYHKNQNKKAVTTSKAGFKDSGSALNNRKDAHSISQPNIKTNKSSKTSLKNSPDFKSQPKLPNKTPAKILNKKLEVSPIIEEVRGSRDENKNLDKSLGLIGSEDGSDNYSDEGYDDGFEDDVEDKAFEMSKAGFSFDNFHKKEDQNTSEKSASKHSDRKNGVEIEREKIKILSQNSKRKTPVKTHRPDSKKSR